MMSEGLSFLPIYVGDIVGASLMILLSALAVRYAWRLTRLDRKSVLWTYLFWLCIALVAFALSRSLGHILRFVMGAYGCPVGWRFLAPYSGGFNSIAFTAVAVLTFYFYTMYTVNERVRRDAEALADAHWSLQSLNQTLEQRVEARTHELRRSEQKFRRLYEASKDMIFFCDADGRLTDINNSGVELLGYQHPQELVGQHLSAFFLDEEKYARYYCTLNSKGHLKDFEVEFTRQDGQRLYLMVTASALVDEDNKMHGCEAIAKDLTHFKQVTDQLIQSENMASVGQLAAGVAHEINTPLGIILGYTQLLTEDFVDNAVVLEPLQIVEKQTKVCKRIVADLLKFSRHTTSGEMTSAAVNQCIEEVLSVVEHTLNMDHIYVQREFAEDLPEVVIDRERLRQVLVNMITNAHHAIGKEGIVGVWSRFNAHCRELEIIIGDTGAGIPPSTIGRIFDPFFTTKGVGKGTGLGLSVSFGIIKDFGGRIEVQSPPSDALLVKAGMHTAFHVFLPVEPAGTVG